ncbi:MoaD/ThiS family protein [Desulfonatronum thioautotrophicum]|uniref:MoaD/ThiS family protein n=1 Tax=Desulfonatronum thioautotrophicum TaxID=617001 RepID=UPI0005EB9E25|nr:MoaD/ThiS family protein [Desulfonatronum thioautotrophicum]
MEVAVKLYPGLPHAKGSRMTIGMREPAVVADLLRELGFNELDVEIISVNGVLSQFDTPLHDGDNVSLIPFIGGG